jgi:hypothetical protein
VLFDSLNSPNAGITGADGFDVSPFDTSFATGSSPFHAANIAPLLNQAGATPGATFTVSLVGGFPLKDVTFVPNFGLNDGSGIARTGPRFGYAANV